MQLYGYLVAFAAALGGFLFGYEIGIINQVFQMNTFLYYMGLSDFDLATGQLEPNSSSDDTKGWITFTFLIGCAFGAAIVSWPMDYIGRRWTIQEGGAFFLLGVILQTASPNISCYYAGRFIAGFGVGQMSTSVPLYISETAETKIRGRLISVYQFMITIGIFIAACVNSLIITYYKGGPDSGRQDDGEWRTAFGVQMIPCTLMMGILMLLPYSPRWLMNNDREDEARSVIAKLRGKPIGDPDVDAEISEIKETIQIERAAGNATVRELFTKGMRYRLFLGVMLQFFQQWTGINVILYYGGDIFQALGFGKASSSVAFILANSAINMVATIPGMWLIEKVGRKPLLVVGGLGMGIAQYLVCIFGRTASNSGNNDLGWGSVIFIFIFIINFSATWGPVVWVYQSEIFPLKMRAKGTSISTVSNWTWNAIISKVAPLFIRDINYFTYLIFGSAGILMALFSLVFVYETKGKTLEEINAIFGDEVAEKSITLTTKKDMDRQDSNSSNTGLIPN